MELSDIAGAGDPGDSAVTSVGGGARVPMDWGDVGVTGNSREEGTRCSHRGGVTEHSGWK